MPPPAAHRLWRRRRRLRRRKEFNLVFVGSDRVNKILNNNLIFERKQHNFYLPLLTLQITTGGLLLVLYSRRHHQEGSVPGHYTGECVREGDEGGGGVIRRLAVPYLGDKSHHLCTE